MTTTSLELSRQLQELRPKWEPGCVPSKIWSRGSTTMDGYKVLRLEGDVVARDLDELRVFALELIELNPKYDATDKQHMTAKLAVVLIQGCDPTAEWILKTFGASNA